MAGFKVITEATDGRHVILSRYTEPEKDHRLLLRRQAHLLQLAEPNGCNPLIP